MIITIALSQRKMLWVVSRTSADLRILKTVKAPTIKGMSILALVFGSIFLFAVMVLIVETLDL